MGLPVHPVKEGEGRSGCEEGLLQPLLLPCFQRGLCFRPSPARLGSPPAPMSPRHLLLHPLMDIPFLEVFKAQRMVARGVGNAEWACCGRGHQSAHSPGSESCSLSRAGRMAGLGARRLPSLGPAVSHFRSDTCRARAGALGPLGRAGPGRCESAAQLKKAVGASAPRPLFPRWREAAGLRAHARRWAFPAPGEASCSILGTEPASPGCHGQRDSQLVARKPALGEARKGQSPSLLPHPEHLAPSPHQRGKLGRRKGAAKSCWELGCKAVKM